MNAALAPPTITKRKSSYKTEKNTEEWTKIEVQGVLTRCKMKELQHNVILTLVSAAA